MANISSHLLFLLIVGFLQQLRLRVPVLRLHFVEVWVLGRHFLRLSLRRVFLRVSVPLGCVDDLPVRATVPRLVRIVEGAALGVEWALLIRIARTPIHRARLILVMALLPLETLEVWVLSGADLVLLRVGQHRLL